VLTRTPEALQWLECKQSGAKPAGRTFPCLAAVGKHLYLFGGVSGEGMELNDLHRYNTENGEWSEVAVSNDTPPERYEHSLTVVGHRLYVFGGGNVAGWRNDVAAFNTETSQWEHPRVGGRLPLQRLAHAAAEARGKVVIFGGYTKKQQRCNDLHVLHCGGEDMYWSQPVVNGECPSKRAGHTLSTVGSSLVVFGGYGEEGTRLNDVHLMDVRSMFFHRPRVQGVARPASRSYHCAAVVGRRLYVFFGSDGDKDFEDVWFLDIEYVAEATKKLELSPSTFAADLGKLVNSEAFSDVVFLLDDGSRVYGHRAVLARRSRHFSAMFESGLRESASKEVPMAGTSRPAFLALMQYLYTDDVELREDSVVEVLQVADRYGEDRLKELCQVYMEAGITVSTVCDLFYVAELYNAAHLQAVCLNNVLLAYESLCDTDAYRRLPEEARRRVEALVERNDAILGKR